MSSVFSRFEWFTNLILNKVDNVFIFCLYVKKFDPVLCPSTILTLVGGLTPVSPPAPSWFAFIWAELHPRQSEMTWNSIGLINFSPLGPEKGTGGHQKVVSFRQLFSVLLHTLLFSLLVVRKRWTGAEDWLPSSLVCLQGSQNLFGREGSEVDNGRWRRHGR